MVIKESREGCVTENHRPYCWGGWGGGKGVKGMDGQNTVCLLFIRYVGIGLLGAGKMELKALAATLVFYLFQLFAEIKP